MSKAAVNPEVIRWALSRAGLTEADLKHKFTKIAQWSTGKSQPSLRQLESLAKATFMPLGMLFLKKPPEDKFPIPYFRTIKDGIADNPSPNLIETIHMMQSRQAWMKDFLLEKGQPSLSYVGSVRPDEDSHAVADKILQTLGFKRDWASLETTWTDALRVMRDNMERIGVLVTVNGVVGNNTHRRLSLNEFRGFVLVDQYAPLVFVNGADAKAAQMFTLAHELAHVFLGSSAAFDLREMQPADNPIELACNRIAAEFLIPEKSLRQTWDSAQGTPDVFQLIARRFKVSVLVAARRALDLGFIKKAEFLDFYEDYKKDEHRRNIRRGEGGDFYATQSLRIGQRFAYAVYRATKEGKLLYSEAYHLTGLYGKSFDRYTDTLSLGA